MKHTLKIGDLTFEYPFVLAPLAGITDRSMRSLCCQAGASLTYTEMVSAKGLWYGDRKTGELLAVGDDEGPVGFQLFGCEPEILAYAVRLLSQPARAKAVDAEMAEALAHRLVFELAVRVTCTTCHLVMVTAADWAKDTDAPDFVALALNFTPVRVASDRLITSNSRV